MGFIGRILLFIFGIFVFLAGAMTLYYNIPLLGGGVSAYLIISLIIGVMELAAGFYGVFRMKGNAGKCLALGIIILIFTMAGYASSPGEFFRDFWQILNKAIIPALYVLGAFLYKIFRKHAND